MDMMSKGLKRGICRLLIRVGDIIREEMYVSDHIKYLNEQGRRARSQNAEHEEGTKEI